MGLTFDIDWEGNCLPAAGVGQNLYPFPLSWCAGR